jgi:hypothetical protein
MVKKGSKKKFDTGVIQSILTMHNSTMGHRVSGRPVHLGNIIDVAEHIFPSAECSWLGTCTIVEKRVRPEIARQLRRHPKFRNFRLRKASPSLAELIKKLGPKVTLISTGR